MEKEQVVQDLIDRAWSLHDRIGDEIKNRYCRSCDYVGAETPLEQRQSLVHIRDSLKELQNMLIFLQRMRSWQEMDRDAAMNRLEESKAMLIEKVTQYNQVTGRDLGVVQELHACFGSSADHRNKKMKEKEKEIRDKSIGLRGLVLCCIKAVLNPWKWRKRIGVAVKLTLVLVTISSSVHYVHTRQHQLVQLQYRSNSRKALDVFDGRG